MKKFITTSTALVAALMLFVSGPLNAATTTVGLGSTESFAILAGSAITDSPTSTIIGNVGLSPAAGSFLGLLCAQVTGTIYAVDGTGDPCFTVNGPLLVTAKNDLGTAYDDAAGRTPFTTVPNELGGTTKTSGVYRTATAFSITAGAGPLVLDAQGDPSAVFIFQMESGATGLVVGPGSTVQLTGGAQACNVFWKLNTATIDTTAVFKGTILANTSITVANGANIEGRLLARSGNVTLINDTITRPTCAATPTLPDAGAVSGKTNTPWSAALLAGAVIATVLLGINRRKKLV